VSGRLSAGITSSATSVMIPAAPWSMRPRAAAPSFTVHGTTGPPPSRRYQGSAAASDASGFKKSTPAMSAPSPCRKNQYSSSDLLQMMPIGTPGSARLKCRSANGLKEEMTQRRSSPWARISFATDAASPVSDALLLFSSMSM